MADNAVAGPSELESHEMEVDIMLEDVKSPENDDDTRMTDDDALHDDDTSATSSKNSTPRPRPISRTSHRKVNKSSTPKAKSRAAAINSSLSAASSPKLSSLSLEIGRDDDNDDEEEDDREQSVYVTRENSPRAFDRSRETLMVASSSSLSSLVPSALTSPVTAPKDLSFITELERLVSLPTGLSAAFESYTPPNRAEDQEEEVVWQARRKGKGRMRVEIEQVEDETQVDERLHCICQLRYDPERLMIACDVCENWYHPDCTGIPDGQMDLVDQFICPLCEKDTPERTNWKRRCARPTCPHPVAPLSKYCSDYCGIEVAATRIELSGVDPERFWSRVSAARRREGIVLDATEFDLRSGDILEYARKDESIQRQQREDLITLSRLRTNLAELVKRHKALDERSELIESRLRYLRVSIHRWEALCLLTQETLAGAADNDKEENKSKKKLKLKGRNAATSMPNAQCGLDVRLVYADVAWVNWMQSEEGRNAMSEEDGAGLDIIQGVCLLPRKKCERHNGWQTVRLADFEVERAVLNRRIASLEAEEAHLVRQISEQEEATTFQLLHRGRRGEGIDIEELQIAAKVIRDEGETGRRNQRLLASTEAVARQKQSQSQSSKTSSAAAQIPSSQASWVNTDHTEEAGEDDYEIPPEVLKFMSLSERIKYRKKRSLQT